MSSRHTLEPALTERRRLISSLDQQTLQALSTHGDQDDRAMAASELRLRDYDRALGEGRN